MRNIYDVRDRIKLSFLFVALVLVAVFLYVSNDLVRDLSNEERSKMEIWADATRELASENMNMDANLILKIIQSNATIPVIITDANDSIIMHKNLDESDESSEKNLHARLDKLKNKANAIEIVIDENYNQHLYYDDSVLLKRLSYYPYIQLGVMLLFVVVAYFALMSTKRAEQNKVWVGLSKETAHQLGTPISSLLAWVDLLELNGVDKSLLTDMSKDVKRLAVIAERFSKIGSKPKLEFECIDDVLSNAVDYIRKRVSAKVNITVSLLPEKQGVMLCLPLFEWVVENLCKNAIDAMDGEGDIFIRLTSDRQMLHIDIQDTGKGIPHKHFKTVFSPGFTTKKRGWGLGLTLVKRIIEEYHDGRIYVKDSEVNRGTTFRIDLPKA